MPVSACQKSMSRYRWLWNFCGRGHTLKTHLSPIPSCPSCWTCASEQEKGGISVQDCIGGRRSTGILCETLGSLGVSTPPYSGIFCGCASLGESGTPLQILPQTQNHTPIPFLLPGMGTPRRRLRSESGRSPGPGQSKPSRPRPPPPSLLL